MKRIFKFIAGNSVVTPIGVAIAIALALALRASGSAWTPAAFAGVLLVTLVACTFERVT